MKDMYEFYNMQKELFDEPLPKDMVDAQMDAFSKASRYFGASSALPSVYVAPELYKTPIYGAYDPFSLMIVYNPAILDDPTLRKKVAEHEGVHSAQPGLKELLCIYALYIEDGKVKYIPIGKAIVEGSAELVLEKIGKRRTRFYEREYEMVKEIDKKVPIGYLHKLAEKNPSKLLEVLNKPSIKRIIEKYVAESYVSRAYN